MQKMLGNVFTRSDDRPRLIGSQCDECQAATFPAQSRCPRCGRTSMSELLLPERGKLVAWTTQGFMPRVPFAGEHTTETFEPFGVGLVQLDDLVRVEARLTENDPARLRFGMEVELAIIPFYVDEDGNEVMTFAFAPVSDDTIGSN